MVSALSSRSNGPGSSPGYGHCGVFLGKTLYSHSTSLHAVLGGKHPIQEGAEMILVSSCYRNRG